MERLSRSVRTSSLAASILR